MTDPLRAEAKAAIATCRGAGIASMMLTGDQRITAAATAQELGSDHDREGQPLRIIDAGHLRKLVLAAAP